jgi:hypothetical protein
VVELPFAADSCPCVEKLRTVLPFTVGIRDGAVQLVSTLGSPPRPHEGVAQSTPLAALTALSAEPKREAQLRRLGSRAGVGRSPPEPTRNARAAMKQVANRNVRGFGWER